jgi:heat shock protein HtpX
MIAALERLKGGDAEPLPDALKAFGIRDGNAFMRLLATHPPLDDRIAALRATGA